MELSEISSSIKTALYERIRSPFIGTFILSWCLINYRIIFVLFSSGNYKDKFDYIDNFIVTNWHDDLYRACTLVDDQCFNLASWISPTIVTFIHYFAYPFIAAIFYITCVPAVSKFVYKITLNNNQKLKKIKDTVEENTLLTKEESDKLRLSVIRMRDEFADQIKTMSDENESLKRMIKDDIGDSKYSAPEISPHEQSIVNIENNLREARNEIFEKLNITESSTSDDLELAYLIILCSVVAHCSTRANTSTIRAIFSEVTKEGRLTFERIQNEAIEQGWITSTIDGKTYLSLKSIDNKHSSLITEITSVLKKYKNKNGLFPVKKFQ